MYSNDVNQKIRILIVGFDNDYEIMDVDNQKEEFEIVHFRFNRYVKSLLILIHRISDILYRTVTKFIFFLFIVRHKKFDYVVCDDNITSIYVLNSSILNGVSKKLIFRNTVSSYILRHCTMQNDKIVMYSFDKADCEKYGLNYYRQYCPEFHSVHVPTRKNKPLAYFLGMDKGRKDLLDDIEINNPHVETRFIIKRTPKGFVSKIKGLFVREGDYRKISYLEHLSNSAESQIIVDIVKSTQSGITMRSLEAMKLGLKLVTNNRCIVDELFYDESRVFILDSSLIIPQEFLRSSFRPIDSDLYYEYSMLKLLREVTGN